MVVHILHALACIDTKELSGTLSAFMTNKLCIIILITCANKSVTYFKVKSIGNAWKIHFKYGDSDQIRLNYHETN